jgi:hypothetical protein
MALILKCTFRATTLTTMTLRVKCFLSLMAVGAEVQGRQATTAQAVAEVAQAVLVLMAAPPMPLRRVGIQPSKARLLEIGLAAEEPLVEQPMLLPTLDFKQNTAAEVVEAAMTLLAKKLVAPVYTEAVAGAAAKKELAPTELEEHGANTPSAEVAVAQVEQERHVNLVVVMGEAEEIILLVPSMAERVVRQAAEAAEVQQGQMQLAE